MTKNISWYDTSDYPGNNRFSMPLMNKILLGKMKDESAGKIMTKFIGLRSKKYAYKMEEENVVQRLKGIKKSVIERKIEFEDYQRCLFDS